MFGNSTSFEKPCWAFGNFSDCMNTGAGGKGLFKSVGVFGDCGFISMACTAIAEGVFSNADDDKDRSTNETVLGTLLLTSLP